MAKDELRNDNEFLEDELEENEEFDDEVEESEDDAEAIIEKLIAQRDDYLDQLQRSRAEFINFRKRTDAEKLRLGEMFTASTIGKFLPVIDDWDRAMANVPENEHDDNWFKGIQMIQTKFHQLLENAGVKHVDGVGAPFDPSMHEAVSVEPGTGGGYVVEVYQQGYKLGDSLLRPAMVKTGDAPEEYDS